MLAQPCDDRGDRQSREVHISAVRTHVGRFRQAPAGIERRIPGIVPMLLDLEAPRRPGYAKVDQQLRCVRGDERIDAGGRRNPLCRKDLGRNVERGKQLPRRDPQPRDQQHRRIHGHAGERPEAGEHDAGAGTCGAGRKDHRFLMSLQWVLLPAPWPRAIRRPPAAA